MVANRIAGPLRGPDRFDLEHPTQGPLGRNAWVFGDPPHPGGINRRRPLRVAEAPKAPKTKPVRAATDKVYLHFYLPITAGKGGYTILQLYEWIRGPEEFEGMNRWTEQGIDLVLVTDVKNAVAALKSSLQTPGAVVVYMGHTSLQKDKGAIGLNPKGGTAPPQIPTKELTALLNKSKASLVVLAGCDSQSCIGTLSGGPVLVVTDSGPDWQTDTLRWSPALKALLDVLLDKGTVNEGLKAAAKAFAQAKSKDGFKLAHGDGNLKINP